MDLIDTHIHLDVEQFADDLEIVLSASRDAGVRQWLNVGFEPARWGTTLALADRTAGMHAVLGLHPGSVEQWSGTTFDRLAELARERKPVAIGEIGIDLHWRQDTLATQIEAFRAQLDLARELDLPAVIHMRGADAAMLDTLERHPELPHIHFHSFDGDDHLRAWAEEHEATIGVGGLLTRAGSDDLREWVSGYPRDRVVLETDAPYLKPRGIRGRRNEPAFMVKTASLLGNLWQLDLESVAALTSANARRVFGL